MARRAITRTGGRAATHGVIPGRYALSVGLPRTAGPPGWEWIALTDVARLETGHTPSRRHAEYWDGEIPWIGIRDATANHGRTITDTVEHTNDLGIAHSSARVLPAGTVCLSRTASIGYVVVMGRPMATSQDFVNWVCSDKIDPGFLKALLLVERESLFRFASGTTHQTIYFPEVKAFHVCLPPPDEQRRIVSLLSALDDKVELNRKMSRTLDESSSAVFRSMFESIDGVPVGWQVVDVGSVVDVRGGTTPSTKDPGYWEHGVHCFCTPKDLSQLEAPVVSDTDRCVTDAGLAKTGSGLLPPGTVLMSSRAPIGYVALSRIPVAVNQGIIAMICSGRVSNMYALHWVRDHQADVLARANGSTFMEISKSSFKSIPMLVPDEESARKFDGIARPLHDRIANCQTQNHLLVQMRDALLPRLLSGELRVADAEKTVEEVV